MAELLPRFDPGVRVPAFAKTAVLAGRFVKVVDTKTSQGDYQIGHCGAGDRAFGVAVQDSAAATDPADWAARRVGVTRPGSIARVKPGANVTFADPIKSDASGQAIPQGGTGTIVGYAMHTGLSTDAFVEVELV